MARRRKSKKTRKPVTITVKRVGAAGTGAAPARRSRSIQRRHGPSPAHRRLTGAVSSARKAASRAGAIVREEPTRVALGFLAGNGAGFGAAALIHSHVDKAVQKDPASKAAEHEDAYNLGASALFGAIAVVAAMVKGKKTGARYVMQTAAMASSHSLGAAGAIRRAKAKKPGTSGSDPFRSSGGGSGATPADLKQRLADRRAQFQTRIASRLRAEDPDGAGTEGSSLESYTGDLFDRIREDVATRDAAKGGTGFLPLIALALSDPKTLAAMNHLAQAGKAGAQAAIKEGQKPTTTAAVLELEGHMPEHMGDAQQRHAARLVRRETATSGPHERREARHAKMKARIEARKGQAATAPSDPSVIVTPDGSTGSSPTGTFGTPDGGPLIVVPSDATMYSGWRNWPPAPMN